MAVDPVSWLRMYPEFEVPEEQRKAWVSDRSSAIVGVDTANKYNWKVGDRVPLISPIYRKPDGTPWDFTIAGIYNSSVKGTDKTQFFFHWDYINETFRNTPIANNVGWYVVRVADPSAADQLSKQIDALFANSLNETKTSTEKAWVSDFAGQIGDIGAIVIRIAALVMGLILFVAGNAMAQSIRERINELGVLKTLGFSDGRILALVLLESCTLAIIGGGDRARHRAGSSSLKAIQPADSCPRSTSRSGISLSGIALVLALGLATGLLPALQASRLKIVDALRTYVTMISQTIAVTGVTLRSIGQRLGSSAVAVLGIAGVVIVFTAVFSIAEGFRPPCAARAIRRRQSCCAPAATPR